MTHSALTFLGVLGCCLLAALSPAEAQRYEVPTWEENSDEALAAAFKKLTGETVWRVRWVKSLYGTSAGETPIEYVNGAYVLGPPGKSKGRLMQGQAAFFWKSYQGERSKGWFPNEPFSWQNVQGMPIEDQTPRHYVMATSPSNVPSKPGDSLTDRIYQKPIFLYGDLSAKESLDLIDATFRELADARPRKPGDFTAASTAFDQKGNPNFGEVSGIYATDPMKMFGLAEYPNRRCVGLSQGGDGALFFVFEFQEGKTVLLDVGGVSY